MQPIIMQDWITIRGTGTATTVTMSQSDWILTAPFQDITFYLDVREVTGTAVSITYETCPSRDDNLFRNIGSAVVPISGAAVTVTSYTLAAAMIPVSHWTRWKLTGTGVGSPVAWDVTFRVMAAGNSVG
ncbi:hypothetical protein BH09MYX1_BH09MYX1_58470 [soil metagenome]